MFVQISKTSFFPLRNAFLVDENWRQKNGNENFSCVIFDSVFVGHTSIRIALASDISSQNQKKTKKRFLICVWRFGNEKNHRWKKKRAEKETKEKRERTTRHTIFERFLNFFFFCQQKEPDEKKKQLILMLLFFSGLKIG